MDWMLGAIGIGVVFLLTCLGFPTGVTLMLVGFGGLAAVLGIPSALSLMGSLPYNETSSWAFVVLPMFLLMGNFAFNSDVGKDAFVVAEAWLGRVPGGLAIATTAACALFGFASGSSIATSAMFTRITLPEMLSRKYDKRLACGSIAASGTLAALIPPSGVMVAYCIFAENVSLGKLLIAGIVPGLLVAASFISVVVFWIRLRPGIAPLTVGPSPSLQEKLLTLRWLGWILLIMIFVFGGIYRGVFTANEAGALGAMFVFIILVLRKGFQFKLIARAVVDAAGTTGMVFLVVVGALAFSRFLVASGLLDELSRFILGSGIAPTFVLIGMLVIYLILGTFLDAVGAMAVTLPIFLPVVQGFGWDGVWFGLLVVVMVEIGMLTPPLALNVFAVKAAAAGAVTLEEVYGGVMPFYVGYLFVIVLLITFPEIVLWLPSMMMK